MTRIKKELQKKNSNTDRIRRIKDQKKVINSKNVVKVRDTNFKRFLEQSVHEEKPNTDSVNILNNNNLENVGAYTENIINSSQYILENAAGVSTVYLA